MEDKIDKIGVWSKDKLNILKKYLNAYTKILNNQKWCTGFYYIDAFSGPSIAESKDEEIFIQGSPLVAINLEIPFKKYYFIELDRIKKEILEEKLNSYQKINYKIEKGNCNSILIKKIIPIFRRDKLKRGFIFLDPYGIDYNWDTIKEISLVNGIEILLNFSIMGVNRYCFPNKYEQINDSRFGKINKFFGNSDIIKEIYEKDNQMVLFGKQKIVKKTKSGKDLSKVYKRKLETQFKFVSEPVIMVNSKNAPLYCLIFCGFNETGLKIMNQIIKKYNMKRLMNIR